MRRTFLLTALVAASFALLAACTPPPDPGMPAVSGVQVSDVANATIGNAVTSRNIAIDEAFRVHVAFIDADTLDVRAARSLDRGQAFGASSLVHDGAALTQAPAVSVATSGRDHVFLAFLDQDGALRVARSTDAGATWSAAQVVANGPFGGGESSTRQLSLTAFGARVYVAVQTMSMWLVRSDDFGATFDTVDTGIAPLAFWDVVVDPRNGHVIVIGDYEDVFYVRSSDHGLTFGPVASPPDVEALYADAAIGPDGRVLIASVNGLERLWDIDADTWSSVPSGELPQPEYASGAIDADGVLHLLTRANLATAVRLSSSDDGGATWATVKVADGEEHDIAAAHHVRGAAYLVNDGGMVTYGFVPNP